MEIIQMDDFDVYDSYQGTFPECSLDYSLKLNLGFAHSNLIVINLKGEIGPMTSDFSGSRKFVR